MTRWSHGSRSGKLNHRSLQGEVKAILEEAAPMATKAEALAIVDSGSAIGKREGQDLQRQRRTDP